MNNTKIITLFRYNEYIPFMICVVSKIEEIGNGIKLTLENGNNVCIEDYGYYFLSESANTYDNKRIINIYARFISELSQISEETIKS